MVMITSVSIDNGSDYKKPSAEVKLASDKISYERITVELTEEETAEVIKLVSEIIATRLRMPAIKAKLEAAKSVFPPVPEPVPSMEACVHGIPLSLHCRECNPSGTDASPDVPF